MPRLNTAQKAHDLTLEQEALLLLSWAQKLGGSTADALSPTLLKRHRTAQKRAYRVFRARCEEKATRAGQELQQLLQERQRDAARLQSEPNNERAQEAYRVAVEEIAHQRALIERCNKAMGADVPSGLGGFVDLPFEKYPEKLGLGNLQSEYGMEDVYTVLIGLAVTVLGVLALLYLFLWSKEAHFELIPSDVPTGRVVVRIYNDATRPIDIVAPLDTFAQSEQGVPSYGIELHVREKGRDAFQLVSPPDNAWTYQGTPTRMLGPVRVAPKITLDISLSFKALEQEYPRLDGYRLVIKEQNGRELQRFEQHFMR